jgi:aromatic-L-amino-acid decarboxylase
MSQLPISATNSPLELTGHQFRQELSRAIDQLVPYLDGLSDADAWTPHDSPSADITPREPALGPPSSFVDVLDDLFQRRIHPSFSPASGGYLAYVPGGGIPHSAIADLISGIINKYVTVWSVAPGLANIEADVISWFNDLIGFPAGSGGYLTTGGSMANWSAIVTARRVRLGDDFSKAIIYTSDQSHHSIIKAAVLAGFPEANVHLIPCDTTHRINLLALKSTMTADREAGLTPFLITGHAGTAGTAVVSHRCSLWRIFLLDRSRSTSTSWNTPRRLDYSGSPQRSFSTLRHGMSLGTRTSDTSAITSSRRGLPPAVPRRCRSC